jgi:sugar/nucleoside kinase (ribokinase family)
MAVETAPAPIAAILGGHDTPAADVLRAFARRLGAQGVRVGGVVAASPGDARAASGAEGACKGVLEDVATGEIIAIHQNLGPGSQSCNLDIGALALAAAAVERAIADGAELVVLSKFGVQEKERRGLMSAFQAATAAGVPVACVVAPRAVEAWQAFAADLAIWVPAEQGALEAWWRSHVAARRAA